MATGDSSVGITRETSKEVFQERVHLYFLQLTEGCGRKHCTNPHCATGSGVITERNEAAANAVFLAARKAQLCMSNKRSLSNGHTSNHELKDHRKSATETGTVSMTTTTLSKDEPMDVEPSPSAKNGSPPGGILSDMSPVAMETGKEEEVSRLKFPSKDSNSLTESKVLKLLEEAQRTTYKELTSTLWNVFGSPQLLNSSFLISEDINEFSQVRHRTGITVDVEAVRRVYAGLFENDVTAVTNTLANVMDAYTTSVTRDETLKTSGVLNHVVTLFENPMLHSPEFLERAFPKFLSMIMSLSIEQKALLVEWYSSYSADDLTRFISSLQQLIVVCILTDEENSVSLQSNTTVAAATHVLMLFYIANLVIAKRQGGLRPHSTKLLSSIATPLPDSLSARKLNMFEILLSKFEVHPSEVLSCPIPLEDFVIELLNKEVHMLIDLRRQRHKGSDGQHVFCFLDHPFVLTPANKVETLHLEHSIRMISERQRTLFTTVLTGIPDLPFLLLRVDRHDLLNDTLAQLEAIAELNPADLRKQLRVEFRGEEGIDEGGLQKEFFQLLVEKLFDPMNGMFTFNSEEQYYWFNIDSFESEQQYHLIGILLGLAIYNNVILDVHFPMVVYHKLIGCQHVFQDLFSSHPDIARGLQSMLDYNGSNFEDTFMATFSVTYSSIFESVKTANLKENGDQIPVTIENRKEYVELYTKWLLVDSIAKQFDAFKSGFDIVMGDRNLADLFTAEEVELLICGSKEWDFNSLEENTRYDGYTKGHPVIKNFWEVFNEYSDIQKKQLLAFVTGSDRVPVGGLSKLKMVIVKNGPDSDRLPTAHTCFNALLLCEYSSKDKLRERLTTAINNGKGFGML